MAAPTGTRSKTSTSLIPTVTGPSETSYPVSDGLFYSPSNPFPFPSHHDPPFPPPPSKRRLAALVYELLLTGAVTSIAALAAGIAAIFLNPVSTRLSMLTTLPDAVLRMVGSTSAPTGTKKGKTLAMQTWKIGLPIKMAPAHPCHCACVLFGQAFFIVFIPPSRYAGLRHLLNIPPKGAFGAALIWLILPRGFALFHPDRQFLYDFLAGTRLVDLNQKKTNE